MKDDKVIPLAEAKRRRKSGGSGGSGNNDGLRGPDQILEEFRQSETGLFARKLNKDGEFYWYFVCSPIEIIAETMSESGQWGLLIEWTDRDGNVQRESFGRALIAGDCLELRARLAARGMTLDQSRDARLSFARFLNLIKAPARAATIVRTGWAKIADQLVYVLPDEVFGSAPRPVIFESSGAENPFGQAGSLDAWRREVAGLAPGNSRLLLAISAAFAAPLLNLIDADNFGLHLRGASRTGKSGILRAAGSVWGGGARGGAADFVQSWKATAGGLEIMAGRANDGLLLLDELGEADPAACTDATYAIANGAPKARMTRDGTAARPMVRWRLIFLSSGELALSEKLAEARRTVQAGQELRFLEIEADASVGLGAFGNLHEHESSEDLVSALRAGTRANYGLAARHFLGWLTGKIASEADFVDRVRDRVDDVAGDWLSKLPNAAAQVRSTAWRFALLGIAGELATEAGTTGWTPGDATEAAGIICREWIKDHGGGSISFEESAAVERLTAFIARYVSRFEIWVSDSDEPAPYETENNPPPDRGRQLERYGYRRWVNHDGAFGWEHFIYPFAMREALEGLNFRSATNSLSESGAILRSNETDGRLTHKVRLPGARNPERVYLVPNNGHPVHRSDAGAE